MGNDKPTPLELLQKFFEETPKDKVKEILAKYENMEYEGVTVDEYFNYVNGVKTYTYVCGWCHHNGSNTTGSNFCDNCNRGVYPKLVTYRVDSSKQ